MYFKVHVHQSKSISYVLTIPSLKICAMATSFALHLQQNFVFHFLHPDHQLLLFSFALWTFPWNPSCTFPFEAHHHQLSNISVRRQASYTRSLSSCTLLQASFKKWLSFKNITAELNQFCSFYSFQTPFILRFVVLSSSIGFPISNSLPYAIKRYSLPVR